MQENIIRNKKNWLQKHKCCYKTLTRKSRYRKMTARCAQYMIALKIVCKRNISRWLRNNLHITVLSLFGGEIIFEVFQPMWSRHLIVT